MQITKGVVRRPVKVVVYGPEGIGKSTFASRFPDPVFIDTEGSTYHMDVPRLPRPTSWNMLIEAVNYIKRTPGVCQTLIIDTADWAEQLCAASICAKSKKESIEDFGYGKGYVVLMEEFGRLLNLLEEVVESGVHVVLTAHAKMRKFEQPDEMGAYDRWEMKLSKQVAPMVKEWADIVLFANYRTIVVQDEKTKSNKAQGGTRVIYTTHHACWDAKNRHALPDCIPMDFAAIAHVVGQQSQPVTAPQKDPDTSATPAPQPPEVPTETVTAAVATHEDPEMNYVPKALRDLMAANAVTLAEIKEATESKGYVSRGTPFRNYDPAFVDGVLIAAFPQVLSMIQIARMNNNDTIPF